MYNSFLHKWGPAILVYGCTRKIYYLWDANVSYYDSTIKGFEHIERPLMVTEKAAICTIGTFGAVYGWPLMVAKDAMTIESNMRGFGSLAIPSSTLFGHFFS